MYVCYIPLFLFFFNHTPTTEIYTLSLHDALPIFISRPPNGLAHACGIHRSSRHMDIPMATGAGPSIIRAPIGSRSEEHTSELQSRQYLVCRLLLEKKKKKATH